MSNLVNYLTAGFDFDPVKCEGYTENELDMIARLYKIDVVSMLKSFFIEIGRSSGGLLCEDQLPLYNPDWKVRDHLYTQFVFYDDLQNLALFNYLNKPFVFSILAETQYYFLQTNSDDPDSVYRYDENDGVVYDTETDLFAFLKELVDGNMRKGFTCHDEGNLLLI